MGGALIAGGLALPRLLASERIDPPLAPDPEVTGILDGLGDNSLAVLPATRVAGEFNDLARLFQLDKRGPMGRDFTIKMVWAPERRRALFCGANHGSPHRLNDCWEFDLAANTWQLLYAPDYNDSRNERQFNSKVLLKDGVIQTERGGPVHVAHTWWQLTYDPVRKRLLWMCCWPGQGRLHEIYKFPQADLYPGPPLWSFDPARKQWELLKSTPPHPGYAIGTWLEYVPDLGGSLFQGRWLFLSSDNSWKQLAPKGDSQDFPTIEAVLAYDPANHVLVAHKGTPEIYRDRKGDPTKRTWQYDVRANSWKLTRESKEGPNGHDAWTPFGYDPVGQVVLVCDLLDQGKFWAYSVRDNQWTLLKPRGAELPKLERVCGYFDPAQNVFVINSSRTTVVYRYKRK
jgi:hypothetical protein